MPNALEAIAPQIGAELAAIVQPMLKRLEDDCAARIAAASVRSGMINREGALVLTMGDGSQQVLGVVVGADGKDGTNGLDGTNGADGEDGKPGVNGQDGRDGMTGPTGLGFEDLDVSLSEDGRTVVLSLTRGDLTQTFELFFPVMIYRGVYDPDHGLAYEPGDTVTYGGSLWVCNAPTKARPGEGEGPWRLAVKRGRDGKDFAGPQMKVPA